MKKLHTFVALAVLVPSTAMTMMSPQDDILKTVTLGGSLYQETRKGEVLLPTGLSLALDAQDQFAGQVGAYHSGSLREAWFVDNMKMRGMLVATNWPNVSSAEILFLNVNDLPKLDTLSGNWKGPKDPNVETCPICNGRLELKKDREGSYYDCKSCRYTRVYDVNVEAMIDMRGGPRWIRCSKPLDNADAFVFSFDTAGMSPGYYIPIIRMNYATKTNHRALLIINWVSRQSARGDQQFVMLVQKRPPGYENATGQRLFSLLRGFNSVFATPDNGVTTTQFEIPGQSVSTGTNGQVGSVNGSGNAEEGLNYGFDVQSSNNVQSAARDFVVCVANRDADPSKVSIKNEAIFEDDEARFALGGLVKDSFIQLRQGTNFIYVISSKPFEARLAKSGHPDFPLTPRQRPDGMYWARTLGGMSLAGGRLMVKPQGETEVIYDIRGEKQ